MERSMSLLDSRSFRNKLDFFVSVASRKRPRPTDQELAEALEPVLLAAGATPTPLVALPVSAAPVASAGITEAVYQAKIDSSVMAEIAASRPKAAGTYVHQKDPKTEVFEDFVNRARQTPVSADGVRWVALPLDVSAADLVSYLDEVKCGVGVSEQHPVGLTGAKDAWVVPTFA